MRLVVDTSELFSFFNEKSKARELALIPELDLRSPSFALEEIEEHKDKIIGCFSLSEAQFLLIAQLIKTVVKFAKEREYEEFLPEARKLSPDPDDADFFALALKLGCPLWSEDRLLMQQSRIKILPTHELKLLVPQSDP